MTVNITKLILYNKTNVKHIKLETSCNINYNDMSASCSPKVYFINLDNYKEIELENING
jgi:hypothetical protein